MASAHGAGLMVVPVLLGSSTVEAQGQMAGHNHMRRLPTPLAGVARHWNPYDRLSRGHRSGRVGGLSQIRPRDSRKTWFNFNLVWAASARGHKPIHSTHVTATVLDIPIPKYFHFPDKSCWTFDFR